MRWMDVRGGQSRAFVQSVRTEGGRGDLCPRRHLFARGDDV